jgi:hypothetical protein
MLLTVALAAIYLIWTLESSVKFAIAHNRALFQSGV